MEHTPIETQTVPAEGGSQPAAESVAATAPASSIAYTAADKKAKISFILGLVGVVAWMLPIIGLPVTITGLVFGIKGLRSTARHGKAVAGIVLSSVFLIFTIINAALGAYLATTGQLGI